MLAKTMEVKRLGAELSKFLADVVSGVKGVKLAFLFGSYARGKAMPASDVDLAVVAEEPKTLVELRVAVAKALNMPEEKVSILDLSGSSPVARIKVLKYGVKVCEDNEEVIRLLGEFSSDVVEVLDLERQDFVRWLRSSDPIDESVIKSVIVQVEGDVGYLRRLLGTKGVREVVESEDLRRAFERALHLAIEGIVDLLRNVVSGFSLGVAEYYRDYVEIAKRNNVISRESAENLVGLLDLRYRLIHRYRGLNYSEMLERAKSLIDLWSNVLREVKRYLAER